MSSVKAPPTALCAFLRTEWALSLGRWIWLTTSKSATMHRKYSFADTGRDRDAHLEFSIARAKSLAFFASCSEMAR